ncbi:hypothetical protein [Roseateles flavus]|uniref:Uncharacterized protein n=1 Tax=Roseateles flavus TaxID=3149041 RepID=A0ABV0GE58_9BURK
MPRAAWRLALATLVLAACAPRPGELQKDRPFTRCAAFEFRVPDEQALKQAQLLMVEAAIDLGLRFESETAMGGFMLRIGGPGHPMVFQLQSQDGPWTDKYWLGAEHLAGGPPQPPPPGAPSHWKPYVPSAACLEENALKFAELRRRFAARWAVRDGDPKGFLPLKSRSEKAAGGGHAR